MAPASKGSLLRLHYYYYYYYYLLLLLLYNVDISQILFSFTRDIVEQTQFSQLFKKTM